MTLNDFQIEPGLLGLLTGRIVTNGFTGR